VCPDAFRAVAWARAYKDFLEDWLKLCRSLSKLAWQTTSKGSAQAKVRAGMATATRRGRPGRADRGARPGHEARGHRQDGRDDRLGVGASARGDGCVGAGAVPVTMLLADPGTVGARATAETLDRPTELMAGCAAPVDAGVSDAAGVRDRAGRAGAAGAAAGLGDGGRVRPRGGRLAGDTDPTVQVDWPDLTETPVEVLMAAISTADSCGRRRRRWSWPVRRCRCCGSRMWTRCWRR
jgi:hypothetical protein